MNANTNANGPAPHAFATALGIGGLLAFPLAGAALVAHVLEPLAFVAISMTALAIFGAATMRLHRA